MFDIATLSLPIVVIVHVVQVCSGEATILWDNFFSQPVLDYYYYIIILEKNEIFERI
jgi:hypothetical protein